MSRNMIVTLVIIVVLLFGGWWLLTKSQQTSSPSPIPTQAPVVESTPSSEATDEAMMEDKITDSVKEIKVSGSEFAFSPETVSVKQGEKVKITFTNTGKFPHNLMIDELGVATKTIGVGQTDTVEFSASKSGNFTMYCGVGNHRQQGMEGSVQVQK